jgi:hypothetical protein
MDKKCMERTTLTGFFTTISEATGIIAFLFPATLHVLAVLGKVPVILDLAARLFLFDHLVGSACGGPCRDQEKTEQAYIY